MYITPLCRLSETYTRKNVDFKARNVIVMSADMLNVKNMTQRCSVADSTGIYSASDPKNDSSASLKPDIVNFRHFSFFQHRFLVSIITVIAVPHNADLIFLCRGWI